MNERELITLKSIVANIEAGNIELDYLDGDNLNAETAYFNLQFTVVDGKEFDPELT